MIFYTRKLLRPLDGTATRRKYIPVGSVTASLPPHGRLSTQQATDYLIFVVGSDTGLN